MNMPSQHILVQNTCNLVHHQAFFKLSKMHYFVVPNGGQDSVLNGLNFSPFKDCDQISKSFSHLRYKRELKFNYQFFLTNLDSPVFLRPFLVFHKI